MSSLNASRRTALKGVLVAGVVTAALVATAPSAYANLGIDLTVYNRSTIPVTVQLCKSSLDYSGHPLDSCNADAPVVSLAAAQGGLTDPNPPPPPRRSASAALLLLPW